MATQFVDRAVTRAKFDREAAEFRQLSADYGRRGWFLVDEIFPTLLVVLAAPKMKPAPIVLGVLFDYTNYDAVPPSVRFVDPFTRQPYPPAELPTVLNRGVQGVPVALPGFPGNVQVKTAQPLIQWHTPEDTPFLCLPGVREYHEHPGHSGDAWDLHRASGAGRLVRLLEVISKYGVEVVRGFGVSLEPKVALDFGEPPE